MKKYRLTVTEEQLRLIADCVEDCNRLMSGQMEMFKTCVVLDKYEDLHDKLQELQPLVTPNLSPGSYYKWSGSECPNYAQRKFIAQSYAIYREIRHRLWIETHPNGDGSWCVYNEPALRCKEGGDVPIVELIEENK